MGISRRTIGGLVDDRHQDFKALYKAGKVNYSLKDQEKFLRL